MNLCAVLLLDEFLCACLFVHLFFPFLLSESSWKEWRKENWFVFLLLLLLLLLLSLSLFLELCLLIHILSSDSNYLV